MFKWDCVRHIANQGGMTTLSFQPYFHLFSVFATLDANSSLYSFCSLQLASACRYKNKHLSISNDTGCLWVPKFPLRAWKSMQMAVFRSQNIDVFGMSFLSCCCFNYPAECCRTVGKVARCETWASHPSSNQHFGKQEQRKRSRAVHVSARVRHKLLNSAKAWLSPGTVYKVQ